jgi:hypothetical protein
MASGRRSAPGRAGAPRIRAVEAAYQRDALVAKRRVLMTDWAEFCAGDRSANVLRLQRRAGK